MPASAMQRVFRGSGMTTLPLSLSIPSMTRATPSAQFGSTSATDESASTPFQLGSSDAVPTTPTQPLPAEPTPLTAADAQPLLDSFQAQFAYQGESKPLPVNQVSPQPVGDGQGVPLLVLPGTMMPIQARATATGQQEPVAQGASQSVDKRQREGNDGQALLNLLAFIPPLDQPRVSLYDSASGAKGQADTSQTTSVITLDPPVMVDLGRQEQPSMLVTTPPLASVDATQKASQPLAPTLSLSLEHDQHGYAQPLVSALNGHVTWQLTQQLQSAELHLHPAELGTLTVNIHINNGSLQLHISADTPETQQLLHQTANDLKESLTLSQGGQVEVDVSSQGHQQRRQAAQPENPELPLVNHFAFSDTEAPSTDHSILITL